MGPVTVSAAGAGAPSGVTAWASAISRPEANWLERGAVHLVAACGQKAAYPPPPQTRPVRRACASCGLRPAGPAAQKASSGRRNSAGSIRKRTACPRVRNAGISMRRAAAQACTWHSAAGASVTGLPGGGAGRHNQRAILQAHFTAQGAHAVDHGQGIVAKRCGKAVQGGIRRAPGQPGAAPGAPRSWQGEPPRSPAEARGDKR